MKAWDLSKNFFIEVRVSISQILNQMFDKYELIPLEIPEHLDLLDRKDIRITRK